jgi:hypothetical protein
MESDRRMVPFSNLRIKWGLQNWPRSAVRCWLNFVDFVGNTTDCHIDNAITLNATENYFGTLTTWTWLPVITMWGGCMPFWRRDVLCQVKTARIGHLHAKFRTGSLHQSQFTALQLEITRSSLCSVCTKDAHQISDWLFGLATRRPSH